MVERLHADARRRHAAADDAILLEHLDEKAGTAQHARARQAAEASADDSDSLRHEISSIDFTCPLQRR
jgi:hypothetical protein